MASYCCSKYALESFSDCLRREMAVWGLHVNIIEPGSMKTPLTDNILNSINETWNQLPDDVRERWGNDFYKSSVQRFVTQGLMDRAENPQKVINALKHAVMNTAPRIRYRPGFQSPVVFPLSLAPAWLADRIMALTTNPSILPAGVQKRRQT
jgi:NAD(P)-dependent dehydrogenase (short-subunit alcohol dehydrogenase family)